MEDGSEPSALFVSHEDIIEVEVARIACCSASFLICRSMFRKFDGQSRENGFGLGRFLHAKIWSESLSGGRAPPPPGMSRPRLPFQAPDSRGQDSRGHGPRHGVPVNICDRKPGPPGACVYACQCDVRLGSQSSESHRHWHSTLKVQVSVQLASEIKSSRPVPT
jgi:hypothetical protein